MNKPKPDSGVQAPEPKLNKPTRLRRFLSLLLAAILMLSPLAAILTSPAPAYAAAMNTGNPYANGDLIKCSGWGTSDGGTYYRLNLGTVPAHIAGHQVDPNGVPDYAIPADILSRWAGLPASMMEWGISEFFVSLDGTPSNPNNINYTLPKGSDGYVHMHCIEHGLDTTQIGLQSTVTVGIMLSMDYDANTGIYTGTFIAAFAGQQGMQSSALITPFTVTWQDNGKIKVTKSSSNVSISSANSCYTLDGAVYGIYPTSADAKNGTNLIESLTLDGNGDSSTATSKDLVPDTYYVKEIKAAKGYALDTAVYPVTVSGGQTTDLGVKDKPQNDPAAMWVGKVDAETTKAMPLGSASLAGAQFEVKYYDGYYTANTLPAKAERTWIVKTDKDGYADLSSEYLVSGDSLYKSSSGLYTIPLGTITVQEVKAPVGYLLGTQPLFVRQITSEGNAETVTTFNVPTAPEQVKRGDLELIKAGAVSYERMADVPFLITSKTTGESHAVVTDENGYASTSNSWNPHSQNTNTGKTSEDGVWFGIDAKGNKAPVDNAKGALPYDTYIITEKSCTANAGRDLIPPFEITISRDKYTVDLGTLTNQWTPVPEIGTTAKDKDSGTQQACAVGKTVIVDTVAYKNLKPGKEYTVSGYLVDQSTEETLTVGGQAVTASKTFTPRASEGTVDIEFSFDATGLGEHSTVVFESLIEGGKEVAVHADINDGGQTIRFITPKISTTATAKDTGAKNVYTDVLVTIVDTVSFANLVAGKSYTLTGTLYDKATGKPVVIGGKEVTAIKDFTPQSSGGTVEVEFTFDARTLGGHDVVVFESLTRDGVEYATHADIKDSGQTITVTPPEIRTHARDKETAKNQIIEARKVTIIDTVTYKDLVPGKSYTVTGVLMDKSTEATLTVGGKPVTATKNFVPSTANGTVELEFTFDATGLGGRDIVVFETLYREGVEVAIHADINDSAQTVSIVKPPAPKPTPKSDMPKTGDSTRLGVLALVAGVAAGCLVALLILKRQRNKREKTTNNADEG